MKEKPNIALEYRPLTDGQGLLAIVDADSAYDDEFISAIGVTEGNKSALIQILSFLATSSVLVMAMRKNQSGKMLISADNMNGILSQIAS